MLANAIYEKASKKLKSLKYDLEERRLPTKLEKKTIASGWETIIKYLDIKISIDNYPNPDWYIEELNAMGSDYPVVSISINKMNIVDYSYNDIYVYNEVDTDLITDVFIKAIRVFYLDEDSVDFI